LHQAESSSMNSLIRIRALCLWSLPPRFRTDLRIFHVYFREIGAFTKLGGALTFRFQIIGDIGQRPGRR
jgi:hypothetical protein